MLFTREAVIGCSYACSIHAPVVLGLHVIVTALKVIVVGPLFVVVAITLLKKK